MTYRGLLVLTVISSLFFQNCKKTTGYVHDFSNYKTEITVAVPIDHPGIIELDGEKTGFLLEILDRWAEETGRRIKLITGKTYNESRHLLNSNGADIVLSSDSKLRQGFLPVYSTSYSLVTSKTSAKRNRFSLLDLDNAINDKSVVLSGVSNQQITSFFREISEKSNVYFADNHSLDNIAQGDVNFDYIICERSEAEYLTSKHIGLSIGGDIDYEFETGFALNTSNRRLNRELQEWVQAYESSNEYASLAYFYQGNGLKWHLMQASSQKSRHSISKYDEIMKMVGVAEGVDWRLLSAIAYHESRFDNTVVSRRGATGLMQVMPAVARQFGFDSEEIVRPEVNVKLAAKIIKKIEKSLKLPSGISYNEKMSFVLACYNGGIGHVTDARKLAAKHGYNPNSWNDVSFFLTKKGEPEYYEDDEVKCGIFRGSRETLAFIDNVMSKYNSYCSAYRM